MKQIAFFTAVFILVFSLIAKVSAEEYAVNLTSTQQQWIHQHGVVTMCVDPDWVPFESIDQNGAHIGIAADLLKLISQRTGLTFELTPTENWEQSLEYSKQGKCQVMSFLNQSTGRDEWLIFTEPYFTDYNVFITRQEHEFISDPARLSDHVIVIPRDTSIEEKIRNEYPNLDLMLVDSETEAIQMISKGIADMTIRSLTMAAYTIRKEGLFSLKIAGRLPQYSNELRMGVSNKYPELRDIINKGIATITPMEMEQATNNHISIQMVSPHSYKLIFTIAGIFLVLAFLGFTWNYQLRRLNNKLAEKQSSLLDLSEKLKEDIRHRKIIEDKLRDNQQQLAGMISTLPGFVYRCANDEYYTIHFISAGCEEITGYAPSDLIKNNVASFSQIIHPEDGEKVKNKWNESIQNKSYFEHEYRITHRNGSLKWIWERGHAVSGEDGKLLFLEGFITEITDQKLAAQTLSDQNTMIKLLMNSTAEAILGIDNDGNCTFMNKACLTILGYNSKDQVIGKNMHQLIHHTKPDGNPYPQSESPIYNATLAGLKVNDEDECFFRANNQSFPVEYWSYPIFQHDKQIGAVITFIDISRRKEAEKALQESEKKYRLIAENANDIIWILNLTKGCFTYISPSVYQLRGLTPAEAMEEKLEEALTPESYDRVQEKIAQSLERFIKNPEDGNESDITEIQQPCKNGNLVWVEASTQFRYNDQGEIEILGVSRNIEERKKAEQIITTKNKEMESYLYVASHDLRSPLVNIQGFTSRIETHLKKFNATWMNTMRSKDHENAPLFSDEGNSYPEHKEEAEEAVKKLITVDIPKSLSVIYSNAEKMNNLIQGLLTISRTGRIKMNIVKCDMDAILKEIFLIQEFQLEQARATIEIKPLPSCYGDKDLMNQLFSNLIDNAMKYKDPHKPLHLTIEAKAEKTGVTYAVKDNGIGINERNIQKIWNIFYRVDPQSSQQGEGIGLNLAAKIAEKHNGKLWVESIEGEGSTFFVHLSSREFSA